MAYAAYRYEPELLAEQGFPLQWLCHLFWAKFLLLMVFFK